MVFTGVADWNGTVVTIPDASHFLPMEQPEMVARTAAEFFNPG